MVANTRTAARRTQAARKPRPAPAPVVDDEVEYEPVRLTSKPEVEEERVVLFYVDDVEYSIPKKIGRNYGLRYLRTARRQGEALASQELLEVLIGEDGYQALMDCDGLEDEDLDRIMEQLRDGALGAVEEEPGKGRRGR
ncbi:hypothetical protein OG900_33395 [Streptomyces sp. NBC_00433]